MSTLNFSVKIEIASGFQGSIMLTLLIKYGMIAKNITINVSPFF